MIMMKNFLVLALLNSFACAHDGIFIRSTSCDPQYSALSSTHTMCLTDVGVDDPLSATDKQAIVDKHNQFRGSVKPTATNLVKLVWDDDVALVAAKWARQCPEVHDEGDDREVPSLPGVYTGQNIGLGSSSVLTAVIGWHEEVNDFTYGAANDEIGHYTQIVGWRALRIGCGQARCTTGSWPKVQVCNYAVGQINDDELMPYKTGTSCSECPAGQCSNNVCDCAGKICLNGGTFDSKTCSCQCPSIYHGDQCETVSCAPADSGWCTTLGSCSNPAYNEHCPILCGICPGPAGCPNKRCQNGAVLRQDCTCDCYQDYSGDTCETLTCPAHGQEDSSCRSWTTDHCGRFWNVPFQCPRLCGKCG